MAGNPGTGRVTHGSGPELGRLGSPGLMTYVSTVMLGAEARRRSTLPGVVIWLTARAGRGGGGLTNPVVTTGAVLLTAAVVTTSVVSRSRLATAPVSPLRLPLSAAWTPGPSREVVVALTTSV